jgi:Flp pilus assembly secretin CpaC
MKRIREFIIISLALLVALSFFAEYAVTASAPGLWEMPEAIARVANGGHGIGASKSLTGPVVGVWPTVDREPLLTSEFTARLAGLEANHATELTDLASNHPEPAITNWTPETYKQAIPDGNYCDPNFVGRDIVFNQSTELTLEELLDQIHNRYGINFLMGPNLRNLPINIKTGSIPWNVLLRSQLFVSGVRARCINSNTIELVQNSDLPKLQDGAEVTTRFLKLKFLQRTSGGTVDLAGRSQGGNSQGGCGSSGSSFGSGGSGSQQVETASQQVATRFDKLIVEIEKILGLRSMTESTVGNSTGGGGGGVGAQQTEERRTNRFVTQIPGRNILVIRATQEEHALIDQIIARADRPPFQVVIKGLVYSANQDRLRDIGVQTTIVGTGNDDVSGGIFGHTLGGAGTLFDFSAIIGTFDFNVQATALQQNGVISVKSRPFATVLDGLCTTLEVGRQLPIVIDSSLGGVGTVTFVDASNNLAVTPYVVDDDNGNPVAVTLDLRLAANDVDSSVTARGVPAISKRSVQTQLLLGEDKTAILGGFTVDQDSKTVSKTPGLGDIPIIGELFKRRIRDTRINRLYFAISVSVVPFGDAIEPVSVPGATTQPPSLTPEQFDRSTKSEPKQVVAPKKDN